MKTLKISALLLGIMAAFFAFKGGESYTTLEIGEKAPDVNYKMLNTDSKTYSLSDLKGGEGTLVVFSCNTCPFVIAWEDRYPGLKELADKNDMSFVLINSNEAKRAGEDSMEEMIAHAKEMGYDNVPYLIDENSMLANSFGAKTTPHVFLFDKEWKLVYEGAIDDNYKSSDAVEIAYLNDAIKNLSANKKIDPNNTKALGCSIKRVKI